MRDRSGGAWAMASAAIFKRRAHRRGMT